MRFPAEIYRASNIRLDESIKIELYDPATKTRTVDTVGYISIKGNRHQIGEAFAGFKVAIEQYPEEDLIRVRYGNVKLAVIDKSPNARLRPTASSERWEEGACAPPNT
jgi:hypothetical protein